MSRDNTRRLSEIRDQTADLENQMVEATRQGREARSHLERREARDRFRTIRRSSENLSGELGRMQLGNTAHGFAPSFQGHTRSRQDSYGQMPSSSTIGSSTPWRSSNEIRTAQNPGTSRPMMRDTGSSRQRHKRGSRSEDLPPGDPGTYGQPTTYQRGAPSVQGYSQDTDTPPFSNYQPPAAYQQNAAPQAAPYQAPQAQQQTYLQSYPIGDTAPDMPPTSRQQESIGSSQNMNVDAEGSPYQGSRRQFHGDIVTVAARGNTEPNQGYGSYHGSASGSGVHQQPATPRRGMTRPSHSRHRRSSSSPSNTVASDLRTPTAGPTLSSPAIGHPRQTAAPIVFQPLGPSSPLPPSSEQPAPPYRFSPGVSRGQPYIGYVQCGVSGNQYPSERAPPNIGAMTAQPQQPSFNQFNQQRYPISSAPGIPMSGNSLGYPQQLHRRRESSPNISGNAYQNNVPRRMSTPPLGSNTVPRASRYPATHQPTPNNRRGMSPGRPGPRVQSHDTQRQSGTSLPLGGPNSTAGPSMIPTGHAQQSSEMRGRDQSPLRAGPYGTSGQGRNLTPPRRTRERRQ